MTAEEEKAKYEKVWQHDDYRKFSPGLRAIQDFGILDYIKRERISSVLDVGCGSGKAMRFLMERMPNLRVHGFDIADNCLDDWFSGSGLLTTGCLWADPLPDGYDLIICADLCEHLHPEYVKASLNNIFNSTGVAAFFCIALFQDSFGMQLLGEHLHLSLFSSDEWVSRIEHAGFSVLRHSVLSNQSGKPMWLYCMCEKQ